jgi:hypothetical protein
MLERLMPKFRAADANLRVKMVQDTADNIRNAWAEDVEFDRDIVISVCQLSDKLDYSQPFLACSPVSLWEIEGIEEIGIPNPNMDVL